jgi:hypothetical protein
VGPLSTWQMWIALVVLILAVTILNIDTTYTLLACIQRCPVQISAGTLTTLNSFVFPPESFQTNVETEPKIRP